MVLTVITRETFLAFGLYRHGHVGGRVAFLPFRLPILRAHSTGVRAPFSYPVDRTSNWRFDDLPLNAFHLFINGSKIVTIQLVPRGSIFNFLFTIIGLVFGFVSLVHTKLSKTRFCKCCILHSGKLRHAFRPASREQANMGRALGSAKGVRTWSGSARRRSGSWEEILAPSTRSFLCHRSSMLRRQRTIGSFMLQNVTSLHSKFIYDDL